MLPETYRRVVLAARPPAEVSPNDFRLETVALPQPKHREILVRAIYLSLDPYMRGRMKDVPSYAPPVAIGGVMAGGIVGQVVVSNHPDFAVGEYVEGSLGWQEYAIAQGSDLRKIDPAHGPISWSNSILGMPGMTAYFGLFDVAGIKAGETVVVSAASGAVGQAVGQLAKIAGCRVVGIAGGAAKCDYVTRELGFDACVDYKAGDLDAALRAAAPGGVDVYFDNVGGAVADAVFKQMNFFGRIALCGSVSQTSLAAPEMGPRLLGLFVGKRVTMRGFIVFDFVSRYPVALPRMAAWLKSGQIKYREDIVDGIENAAAAFAGLLRGDNFGKMQVRLGPDTL